MTSDSRNPGPSPHSKPEGPAVMPLSQALPGQEVVLVSVDGGRGLQRRLAEMGLLGGSRLRVLSAGRGPIVVGVNQTRLVLGRGMVGRIMVRAV